MNGKQLKDEGIKQVSGSNAVFLGKARRYAAGFCKRKGEVTTDNVRAWAMQKGILPTSPHAWGAIFQGNGWKEIDRRRSVIPSNHSRKISVWAQQDSINA